MTISAKVAYLKGLAEGLGLDTEKSKEGKLISVMVGILEEISLSIEDLEENALALGEEIDGLSDDLTEIESIFSHDHGDEDGCGCGCGDDCCDDSDCAALCPTCQELVTITEDDITAGKVTCSACNGSFALFFGGEEEDGEE